MRKITKIQPDEWRDLAINSCQFYFLYTSNRIKTFIRILYKLIIQAIYQRKTKQKNFINIVALILQSFPLLLFHTIGGSSPVYINSDDSAIWRWMYDKC